MRNAVFPVIDPAATGENILRLRKAKGLTVRDMQAYFGFEEPQAIYKWQSGKSLPSIDNLYALGALLEVPMEDILVPTRPKLNMVKSGQQEHSCCPLGFFAGCFGWAGVRGRQRPIFSAAAFSAHRRGRHCVGWLSNYKNIFF